MGDEKPSVFLQRLRNLAGAQCNDSVPRSLFMEQMPEHMQGILAISQLDDLAKLAAQADRIAEVMRPQIANISQASVDAVTVPQDIPVPPTTDVQSPACVSSKMSQTTEVMKTKAALKQTPRPRKTSTPIPEKEESEEQSSGDADTTIPLDDSATEVALEELVAGTPLPVDCTDPLMQSASQQM